MTNLDKCKQIIDTESGRVLLYRDEVEAVLTAGDTISRQAAIDLLKQMRKDGDMIPWEGKDVFARIRKLPPAQPDIILCKDCKEYYAHDHRCRWWNHGTNEAGWCYVAERREE